MAEESAREGQLEQVDDLGKTVIAVKIKELQEECLEIRKSTSGKYECYIYHPGFLWSAIVHRNQTSLTIVSATIKKSSIFNQSRSVSAWRSSNMGNYFY